VRPKKHIDGDELLKKRLEQLEEYLSLKDTCSLCGAKITEKYKEDDHAVTVLALEWFGDVPQLIQKLTVCDLCAAELPSFELRNPLSRARVTLPPEVQKEAEEEAEEEARRAERVAQTSRPLEAQRDDLEASLRKTGSDEDREKIKLAIRKIDEQLRAIWESGLRDSGLPAPSRRLQEVITSSLGHISDERESRIEKPTRQDYRSRVRRFLRSPYVNKLPSALQQTAYLYAAGLSETEIAKKLKINQTMVSRQVQTIKNAASRKF
jgi:hypothetical protein